MARNHWTCSWFLVLFPYKYPIIFLVCTLFWGIPPFSHSCFQPAECKYWSYLAYFRIRPPKEALWDYLYYLISNIYILKMQLSSCPLNTLFKFWNLREKWEVSSINCFCHKIGLLLQSTTWLMRSPYIWGGDQTYSWKAQGASFCRFWKGQKITVKVNCFFQKCLLGKPENRILRSAGWS